MAKFQEHSSTTEERMAALTRLGILDTPAEADFDDVVLLATEVCQTPVALVTLVGDDRQWFKARLGFPQSETPLDQSVCKYAMREEEILVIPDLRLDPRTADNTLVTEAPFIRFYAGAPLRDLGGVPIGSLCVIDTEARPGGLTGSQTAALRALARQVSALLEARRLLLQQGRRQQEEHAATLAELKAERRLAEFRERSVAVLAHDLRNPLTAIDAGLRTIERDPTRDGAALVLSMMKQSVVRMTRLIETTLDFARTRLGSGLDVQITAVASLRPVLEQVIAELWTAHPEAHIRVKLDLTEPVACDPSRIGQLFSNLLSNALAHGDTTAPVEVTAEACAGLFTLSVANAGASIPPAMQEQLFEPFAHGTNEHARGLGLGLYIAAAIAQAHEGTLKVSSTPEQTCFTFTMPLSPRQATLRSGKI